MPTRVTTSIRASRKFERQPLDVEIKSLAQIVHHPLADAGGEQFFRIRAERAEEGNCQYRDRRELDDGQLVRTRHREHQCIQPPGGRLRPKNVIENDLQRQRIEQVGNGVSDSRQDSEYEGLRVRPEKLANGAFPSLFWGNRGRFREMHFSPRHGETVQLGCQLPGNQPFKNLRHRWDVAVRDIGQQKAEVPAKDKNVRDRGRGHGRMRGFIVLHDGIADRYAFVTDVGAWIVAWGRNQLSDNVLALVAERAFELTV